MKIKNLYQKFIKWWKKQKYEWNKNDTSELNCRVRYNQTLNKNYKKY